MHPATSGRSLLRRNVGAGVVMLFALIYRFTVGEDEQRRLRDRFMRWTPPLGLDVKFHYAFASGGGVAVAEAPTAGLIREALAPFMSSIDCEIEPALSIPEALAISLDVDQWAESAVTVEQNPADLTPTADSSSPAEVPPGWAQPQSDGAGEKTRNVRIVDGRPSPPPN
jgi:hypothetical protein